MATTSFTTHSPPDVSSDDHIVAICTVSQNHCKKEALACHVADFFAFKHLLSRSVPDHHQVWLSACDPRSLDVLRHGTKDVLGAFDEKVVLEQDHRLLLKQFKLSLRQSTSTIWSLGKGKLVILVCGPTSARQDMIEQVPDDFEHTAPELYRTVNMAEAIGKNISSMLMSPSMYTGGWIVNTSLTKGLNDLSSSAHRSNHTRLRLARNCAPLFVSRAFVILTAESSPLRLRPIPNSSQSMLTRSNSRRPEAYDACKRLQNAVSESCYSLVSCAPRSHVFNFAPDLDNWAHLASPRLGATLGELHDRWMELPDHRERPKSNRLYPYYTFGNRKKSQLLHLRLLAWTALHDRRSCLDNWFLAMLDTVLYYNSPEDTIFGGIETQMFQRIMYSFAHHDAARNLAEYFVWLMRTTQSTVSPTQCHDNKPGGPGRKRCLERLEAALSKLSATYKVEGEANSALNMMPARNVEWMAEHILDSLGECHERGVSSEEHLQFILKQLADVTQNLSSLVVKELLTSPWVASAGYGLLMVIKKEPDSERLFMGRLTGVASGHGAPPSELVPVKPRSMGLGLTGVCRPEGEMFSASDLCRQPFGNITGRTERRSAGKSPRCRQRSEAYSKRPSKKAGGGSPHSGSSGITSSSGRVTAKTSDTAGLERGRGSPTAPAAIASSHVTTTRRPTSHKSWAKDIITPRLKRRAHVHVRARSRVPSVNSSSRFKTRWVDEGGERRRSEHKPSGVADLRSSGTGAPLHDSEEDLIDLTSD